MASYAANGELRCVGTDIKVVFARIFPAGTGTHTVTSQGGVVAGVDDVGAGKIRLKLAHRYYKLLNFQCSYQEAADNVDLYAQGGEVTLNDTTNNGGNTSAIVKLKTGATNTDNAGADANDCINVMLVFEDSAAHG